MKRSIKCNRPKADFGLSAAIIGAIASMASAGVGAIGAKKARKQQAEIENYNNALVASENLSENAQQSLDNQIELERQNNVKVRCGGRRKLRYGGSSTGVKNQIHLTPNVVADAKGNFVEIQPGVFYSPNGPSHEQGGINVDKLTKGGKKALLNMEGTEIIDTTNPRSVTVITDKLVDPRTGITYAQEVLNGASAQKVGTRQEFDKLGGRSIALCGGRRKCACGTRRKCACGGRKKALWGWNEEISDNGLTGGDIYSTGASAIANLGSGLMNYFAYKNMEKPVTPTLIGRNSLLTRYNIAPRLTTLENERYNTNNYINRNSMSSASARDYITRTNLQYALAANQLYGEKTNKEADMINANIRYQDEGRENNANLIRDYNKNVADFRNSQLAGKTNSITNTILGLASNVNQFAENVEQRDINKNNAYLTAATAQPEILKYLYSLDPYRFRKIFGMGRPISLTQPVEQNNYGFKINTDTSNSII